jgi:hypothetical protein
MVPPCAVASPTLATGSPSKRTFSSPSITLSGGPVTVIVAPTVAIFPRAHWGRSLDFIERTSPGFELMYTTPFSQ